MNVPIRGKVLFLAGALTGLAAGWVGLPRVLYESRPQPLNFSHKVHGGEKAGMKCEDCHALRDDGTYAGVPHLDKCSGCHAAPMGDTAAEKQLVARYVTPVKEVPWLVYARQPENVYFPHAPHLKLAKLKCERCHGAQGTTDKLRPHEQDRISGYSRDIMRASMTMDGCVDCHRRQNLRHSCLDCHK
jgi:cytochrome c2